MDLRLNHPTTSYPPKTEWQGRSKPKLKNLEPRIQDLARFSKYGLFQAEPKKMMWRCDEIITFVQSSRKIITFLEVLKNTFSKPGSVTQNLEFDVLWRKFDVTFQPTFHQVATTIIHISNMCPSKTSFWEGMKWWKKCWELAQSRSPTREHPLRKNCLRCWPPAALWDSIWNENKKDKLCVQCTCSTVDSLVCSQLACDLKNK